MIMAIYKRALSILMKKPFRLWGISLLGTFLAGAAGVAFGLIPIIGVAIALLLEVSLTMILLRGYRGEENPRAVDLFETFQDWATVKRVLCGMGWMILWIFLWSLIPIVGFIFGIIRAYEYRLTPYILMLEPDVKPTEAIRLSKERTKGWKGKMFGADILVIVFFVVAMLVLGLLATIPFVGWLFGIIAALFSICFGALFPLFIGLVQAAFYEEIQTWGTYPGREAYAPARGPAPGGYPPPQGYDPAQQYAQQYPPQGYQQYPQQGYQQPQQPVWQPPQQDYPPQQPAWQPPQQDYPPQQPVWQQPQQPQPTWQPPEPPQPTWQPPEPPAAPNPPEGWQEPPQE